MPKATVYIRNEDWDRWQALQNKADFIHEALKGTREKEAKQPRKSGPSHPTARYVYSDGVKYDTKKPSKKGLCEHSQPKGQCLNPKCKHSRYGK